MTTTIKYKGEHITVERTETVYDGMRKYIASESTLEPLYLIVGEVIYSEDSKGE
jgi:hypothetical protein